MRSFLIAFVAVVCLLARVALGADANVDPSESEEIGPLIGLGLIAILALIGLTVVAVALVLAVVLCVVVGVLVLVGIVSTSVAVGIVRRNPAAGLRVLFIQAGAVFGAVCGTVVAWLMPDSGPQSLLAGAVAGLFCGSTLGVLFNRVWGRAASRIVAWYAARHGNKPAETPAA
jgi:hypothetical protein